MLGEKSLYWMTFLLLSFSALNVNSDEILKIYSSEQKNSIFQSNLQIVLLHWTQVWAEILIKIKIFMMP